MRNLITKIKEKGKKALFVGGLGLSSIWLAGNTGCQTINPQGQAFLQGLGQTMVYTYATESIKREVNPNQINVYVPEQNQQPQQNQREENIARSLGPSNGKIHNTWIDHNKIEEGEKGMRIHAEFSVYNNKGWETQIAAYMSRTGFFSNKKLKDKDGRYAATDGQVSARSELLRPNFENTLYHDVSFFFPYSQFDLNESGKYNIQIQIELKDLSRGKNIALDNNFINIVYTK
ncbi:MAG: hypothetical protein WC584_01945 [Candidatus Pacearchaeota archaeon]